MSETHVEKGSVCADPLEKVDLLAQWSWLHSHLIGICIQEPSGRSWTSLC